MASDDTRREFLSVIFPCYNESILIENSLSKLVSFLDTMQISYEIIFIDDFSRDDSVNIIKNLQSKDQKVKLLRNPCNMGKGFAIKNGILNCNGEYIIFTDIDMVYSLNNIKTVLEYLQKGNDIVVGNRRLQDSIYTVPNSLIKYVYKRHMVGTIFNTIVRYMFGLKVRDTQSGLKGFNRETALAIFSNINTNRFVFDVEIFILAKNLKKSVKEIPVHLTYFSQLSTVSIFKYSIRALHEILTIKLYHIRGKYSKNMHVVEDSIHIYN
jgi:glycosyltransferase involved in cell wall biosynthesis